MSMNEFSGIAHNQDLLHEAGKNKGKNIGKK